MRLLLPSNKSGFTLVEVLVIVFVLSFLSITALGGYFNSNITLDFLSNFKEFRTLLRSPRSYAINNKVVDGTIPPSYGIYIGEVDEDTGLQEVVVFADNGDVQQAYDDAESDFPDTVMPSGSLTIDTNFYELEVFDSTNSPLEFPVTLFYESSTADFSAFYDGAIYLPKSTQRYLAFEFVSVRDPDLFKYLVIFQVAGLSEESNSLPNTGE